MIEITLILKIILLIMMKDSNKFQVYEYVLECIKIF